MKSFINSAARRMYQRAVLRAHAQSGQAMTEYIFLIIFVALVCIPVMEMLPQAVLGYVRPFYYCISRPIP